MSQMIRRFQKCLILLLIVCFLVLFLFAGFDHVEFVKNILRAKFQQSVQVFSYNKSVTIETKVTFEGDNQDSLYKLLDELDVTIRRKSPESKIYGNIYNGKGKIQVESYISAIKEFSKKYPIRTICEIGFAGGHSATLFLHSTDSASYTAFDMWDRAEYEDSAIAWIRKRFSDRQISLVKGDSTKTVPQFAGKCDLIHVDGAHHAHFPKTDMKNMARVASVNNLLLLDDCSKSWPAVLKGVDYLKNNDLVHDIEMHVPEGWIYRGAQKGWCIGSYKVKAQTINTSPVYDLPKSISFLDKTFCRPPWHGDTCAVNDNKQCSQWSDECFYSKVTGTLSVSCERWHGAQSVEQVTWDQRETATDRNEAHAKSFNFYQSLPDNLGDIIEIGAGPFTQSQTILKDKNATSITLVEPMAFHYMTHVKRCFYKNGSFMNLPTTLLSMPAEELNNTRKFDSLVMINVIEHVYDALSILNSAINLIKENGLFIWHERLWDNYRGVATPPGNDREFQLHPIRIKTVIAKHIMSMFEEVYASWDTEELRRLKNQGVYFIGRRRNMVAKTVIPQHPACFERSKGKQTVIFFVSNMNSTFLQSQLMMVNDFDNTKSIILIQTDNFTAKATAAVLKFSKIRIMISHQHLQNWRKEVSYYVEPCMFIYPHLTSAMLVGADTLCVGNSGVTVVLMGYSTKRFPNYNEILPAYTKYQMIDQILLLWNNKNASFTSNIDLPKLTFIQSEVNSMNNRFNVSQYIRTDAVLVIDDDVLISEALLSLMLLRWSENPSRLVGISRDMRYVNSMNEYIVRGKNPSLTIGKTMLFHRKYLVKYMQDTKLVDWNSKRYCEDISMNALIFKETNLRPLFVPMSAQGSRKDLSEVDGASVVDTKWALRRTECVQWAAQYFQIKLY
ncbi:Hypothetical predicted protein [Mytilus galloprovincialis]|uniref:Glycosyl transferase 64 domain-containing protein n=1 Tax=Mytilus galloprovincialis TaxID=29158 RepID=A0A8B6D660_MYTGA|nr:Hypothetical predicted protein [Mytilus galloprovincialis]